MRQKGQIFIFNDDELSLIKNTFADNEDLLYLIRKVLLQFPITKAEKNIIKLTVTEDVYNVLKKRLLPELNNDFPFGQLSSFYTTITNDLKARTADDMDLLFEAKQLEVDYLEQQFAVLKDITLALESSQEKQEIKLADLGRIKKDELRESYVNMTAYLFLLGYVDPMLLFIKSIAGQKNETVEQAKKRMERDSSK